MLEKSGYRVTFLPALGFEFLNLEQYSKLLMRMEEFSAIVFTSQQAVKATQQILISLAGN